jgi:hypothetical protein
MDHTAGWNIWGYDGALLRQFTVAKVSEAEALALLLSHVPQLTPVSRHTWDRQLIEKLGLTDGAIIECVPVDPKHPLIHAGGEPFNKRMPSR